MQVLQILTVAIITLVLLEQAVLQIITGQAEVETLRQEVRLRQIITQEVHHLQAHQAGEVVHLLQAVAEHQEVHRRAVEVAVAEVAVGQDN